MLCVKIFFFFFFFFPLFCYCVYMYSTSWTGGCTLVGMGLAAFRQGVHSMPKHSGHQVSDFFTCTSQVLYSHFCFGTHILNFSESQDSQSYSGKFCNGRNDFLVVLT